VDSYAELEAIRRRGEVERWQADYLMKTKDGRKIWVSDVSRPWFDKKGAIIGSNGSLRDITERINAEQKIRNELTKNDYTDTLTGLANLRKFWLRIEEELRRSRRTRDPVCVMLVSIDKLEEIGNAYDKKMVETITVTAARLIRPILREIDIIAHIEEGCFGVVMPETNAEAATYAARRLIKTISEHSFFASAPDAKTMSVTLSIGLADATSGNNTDANTLYRRADAQLYAARQKGENQIVADAQDEK
jgi:diguanylate cyclase (GGDEF)-like protein